MFLLASSEQMTDHTPQFQTSSLILHLFIFISLSTFFDCNMKKSESDAVDSLTDSPHYVSLSHGNDNVFPVGKT